MSSNESDIQYNWINGTETLEDYTPGGYHPIMVGDKLHSRYCIVDKLGYGGYSTVWLARDTRQDRYVAIKVGIANIETDSLSRETKALKALSGASALTPFKSFGRDAVPSLLDEFKVHGPNGTHLCYATTPARCNLKEVSYSRIFPIEVARALVGGLTLAVAYTHSKGYVHGDIHLQNILLKLPSSFDKLSIEQFYEKYGKPQTISITRQDGKQLPPNVPSKAVRSLYLGKHAKEFELSDVRVLLGDFGEAFAPGIDNRVGEDCNTPIGNRPPEAHFEPQAKLSYPADIWSLATVIWEILGMKAVFWTDWATTEEIIAQQIDELGPLPTKWWDQWGERSEFFDKNGRPKKGREVWPSISQAFEEWVQVYRREAKLGEFNKEETAAILDLLRSMLAFQPENRPTAQQVLKSEWMVKWVLPDFERSARAE